MNQNFRSLTIIIPALNEEGNIRGTCEEIIILAQKFLSDYEILVFDDASTDRTGEVVKELQQTNPHIVLVRNPVNRGLGYNYRTGAMNARCQYTMMVPGDNEVVAASLAEAFQNIGETNAILFYASNPEVRHISRRFISWLFTGCLNLLFGLKIRYFNGPCIIRRELAQEFAADTSSFAYMAILLVQLLKAGFTYSERSFSLRGRSSGRTKAFRFQNVINVVKDILSLHWRLRAFGNFKSNGRKV